MDLKSNPFFLQDSDVAWVNGTLAAMSLKEKIEHLFCLLVKEKPAEEIIADLDLLDFQPGSYMTDIYPAQVIKTNFQKLQGRTAIPLLFASNLERGADGICTEGTLFGTQMQVAAAGDPRWAYELGRVCAQEAAALGANWNFSPVVDIDYDFHNPITNTRAFSSDPDIVRELSLAYIKGMRENGMAVCAKHFPGDGRDERDQHMVTSINDCSVDEWDQTYGKIYQAIIDAGAETIMAAQIMLPAYSRALRPNLKDEEILSGVLSYELKNDLLRDRLGFNGLIV
ncbi:MAG TPA: beta-hexosaminidase, partial [Clostridiales bacterium]|nr:beta-hexosaminidase [Clostridiales bacterium]